MPAPSNRTGIPTTLVVLLLAAMLLAGFGLGPRVFEFSAWPQPTREDRVEEVVARSAGEATEVPVVRVRDEGRARSRQDALAVRGRSSRRRGGVARPELSVRSDAGSREGSARRDRGRGGSGGGEPQTPPPTDVVIVEDPPAATPDVPAPVDAPEEPTQLAELAEPQAPMLRPDAKAPESLAPAPASRDDAALVEVDAAGLLDEVDRLLDGLLPGEDGGERRGPHGHR
jgi:hypothetical protein